MSEKGTHYIYKFTGVSSAGPTVSTPVLQAKGPGFHSRLGQSFSTLKTKS